MWKGCSEDENVACERRSQKRVFVSQKVENVKEVLKQKYMYILSLICDHAVPVQ